MIQTLPPWSSRCNEGGNYTQIFKTHSPPSETACKCSSLFRKHHLCFSFHPLPWQGHSIKKAVPQHLSFCTNPVLQRQVETTLWASHRLTNSSCTPVSPPSTSETRFPTSREEREHAHDHTVDILGTLLRNRSSAQRQEIITI